MGIDNRSMPEIQFLNSNSTWVKLSSSVDCKNIQSNISSATNDITSELAKNNILFGGSLYDMHTMKQGIGYDDIQAAYSIYKDGTNQSNFGLRPMPGITGVNINHLGSYGSTRKATVQFKCWDVAQLNALEVLYMRPGYTVLLEFGRTLSLEYNDSGLPILNSLSFEDNFFERKDVDVLPYVKELYNNVLKSNGNYDAFFGYITNYNWSLNTQGGYDCSIDILSTGEILESIKVNYPFQSDVDMSVFSEYDDPNFDYSKIKFKGKLLDYSYHGKVLAYGKNQTKRINYEYSKNVLSGLMYELYCQAYNFYTLDDTYSKYFSDDYEPFPLKYITYNSNNFKKGEFYNDNINVYITLEYLIWLINDHILLKSYDKSGKKIGDITKISTDYYCLYNRLMISTNPDICWVDNQLFSSTLSNELKNTKIEEKPIESIDYNKFIPELSSYELSQFQNVILSLLDIRASRGDLNQMRIDTYNIIINHYNNIFNKSGIKSDNVSVEYIKIFNKVFQTIRGGIITEQGKRTYFYPFIKNNETLSELKKLGNKAYFFDLHYSEDYNPKNISIAP
jgi:hypothetical protein